MTILPARRLEAKAPALRKKGRLQRGADADITIFDPDRVIDRSTVAEPAVASAGHRVRAHRRPGGEVARRHRHHQEARPADHRGALTPVRSPRHGVVSA